MKTKPHKEALYKKLPAFFGGWSLLKKFGSFVKTFGALGSTTSRRVGAWTLLRSDFVLILRPPFIPFGVVSMTPTEMQKCNYNYFSWKLCDCWLPPIKTATAIAPPNSIIVNSHPAHLQ